MTAVCMRMCRADTKESLEKHFEKSRQLAEKADKGLYVLYIQCFEVWLCICSSYQEFIV